MAEVKKHSEEFEELIVLHFPNILKENIKHLYKSFEILLMKIWDLSQSRYSNTIQKNDFKAELPTPLNFDYHNHALYNFVIGKLSHLNGTCYDNDEDEFDNYDSGGDEDYFEHENYRIAKNIMVIIYNLDKKIIKFEAAFLQIRSLLKSNIENKLPVKQARKRNKKTDSKSSVQSDQHMYEMYVSIFFEHQASDSVKAEYQKILSLYKLTDRVFINTKIMFEDGTEYDKVGLEHSDFKINIFFRNDIWLQSIIKEKNEYPYVMTADTISSDDQNRIDQYMNKFKTQT